MVSLTALADVTLTALLLGAVKLGAGVEMLMLPAATGDGVKIGFFSKRKHATN